MIVYEFNGKKECNNLIELQEVLKHRSKGNSNEFELRTELEYPFLTILIKEELACVHYFKDENDCWYAVKWGASYIGRKKYAGFMALFNHLEYIASLENQINIDFWGRRNKTYDSLKNNFINRKHIIIYKKED